MGGMSTDWGSSRAYDFSDSATRKSARDYSAADNRTYTGDTSHGLAAPVGKEISTKSRLATILAIDTTGSMRDWPKLIFEKIATLYTESNVVAQGLDVDDVKKKGTTIDDTLEIAVIAFNDAGVGDSYPIQVVDFSKGADLVKGVNSIRPAGGGGGNLVESYDLAAYFVAKHCKAPNAGKPLFIFAGDEGFYEQVVSQQVRKLIGDDLAENMSTTTVLKDLMKRFNVYILRPEPYYDAATYRQIQAQWEGVLGPERVLKMDDPQRLVDCIIGLHALAANNFKAGEDLLRRRQTEAQVDEVLKTLHPAIEAKSKKNKKK